jgi:hypothetical protein
LTGISIWFLFGGSISKKGEISVIDTVMHPRPFFG